MKNKEIKKDLFKVEELEPRLEMIWDDNSGCGDNSSCGDQSVDQVQVDGEVNQQN